MNKRVFLENVKELADRVYEKTLERAEFITKSGAVDFSQYENDFRLPKNFIVANAKQTAWDYSGLKNSFDKADIENIFINL